MISMPFDSKIVGFDSDGIPQYDRASSAAEFATLFSSFLTNGVFGDGMFAVTALTGMQVQVSIGKCVINGRFGFAVEPETVDFSSDNSYPRIDSVVLRMDLSEAIRGIVITVHQGTAALSPTPPTLTRTSTVWELGIANVLIPANSTAIAQARITDTRLDPTRCGIVAAVNSEIDTSALYYQIQSDLEHFRQEEKEDFEKWFDELQSLLAGDVAVSLAAQIAEVTTRVDSLSNDVNSLAQTKTEAAAQMVTLTAAGWSDSEPYTQTLNVQGVMPDNVVFVSPDPGSFDDYTESVVRASAQSINRLTFTAASKPSDAIDVNVVVFTGVRNG